MAKQIGNIRITGTVDGLNFYKTQEDGYLVRRSGRLDPKRIANDPVYQRFRETGNEFTGIAKAGKVMRTAFLALLQHVQDRSHPRRLNGRLLRVVQADKINVHGKRNVADGDIKLLEGFNFNSHSNFEAVFTAPFTAAIDRVRGTLTLHIPSFIPAHSIAAPAGSTHFKIVTGGAAVEFKNKNIESGSLETIEILLDGTPGAEIHFVIKVPPNSTTPLFLAAGIRFYQAVNGAFTTVEKGQYNALELVKVLGV